MAEWDFFTIRALADHLKLNQQTVRNWVNDGKLPYIQVGRTKHIPRAAAVALAGGTGLEMPKLLTVAETAQLLQVHEMTIRNWIDAGTLAHVWLGERRVRIKQSDLDTLLDAGITTTPEPIARDFWLGDRPVGEPVVAQDHSARSRGRPGLRPP